MQHTRFLLTIVVLVDVSYSQNPKHNEDGGVVLSCSSSLLLLFPDLQKAPSVLVRTGDRAGKKTSPRYRGLKIGVMYKKFLHDVVLGHLRVRPATSIIDSLELSSRDVERLD